MVYKLYLYLCWLMLLPADEPSLNHVSGPKSFIWPRWYHVWTIWDSILEVLSLNIDWEGNYKNSHTGLWCSLCVLHTSRASVDSLFSVSTKSICFYSLNLRSYYTLFFLLVLALAKMSQLSNDSGGIDYCQMKTYFSVFLLS